MKPNIALKRVILLTATLTFILLPKTQAEDSYIVTPKDIVASTHTDNIYVVESVANNFKSQRDQLSVDLLNVFQDSQSSNVNRCSAAYYLGEMRSTEAVNALASDIALQFDKSRIKIKNLIKITISAYPAMDALIKIGSPSIPALVQNLARSDDEEVRKLSLKALYQVDGDKDIVRLRLQKAVTAEDELQKRDRLQSALNALEKTSFAN